MPPHTTWTPQICLPGCEYVGAADLIGRQLTSDQLANSKLYASQPATVSKPTNKFTPLWTMIDGIRIDWQRKQARKESLEKYCDFLQGSTIGNALQHYRMCLWRNDHRFLTSALWMQYWYRREEQRLIGNLKINTTNSYCQVWFPRLRVRWTSLICSELCSEFLGPGLTPDCFMS